MATASWTADEIREPPDRHLTNRARKQWSIDSENYRGIPPAALNRRVQKLLGVSPDEWPFDNEDVRLRLIGEVDVEVWLLHLILAALETSLNEFAYGSGSAYHVETIGADAKRLHRDYRMSLPVDVFLDLIAEILSGLRQQLDADKDKDRKRIRRAIMGGKHEIPEPTPIEKRRPYRTLIDNVIPLLEEAARFYPPPVPPGSASQERVQSSEAEMSRPSDGDLAG